MTKQITEHNCDFCNKKEIESKEKWINPSWIRVAGTASNLWGTTDQGEFCSHKCLALWAIKNECESIDKLEKETIKLAKCLICSGLGTVYCGDSEMICPGCSPIHISKTNEVLIKPKNKKEDNIILSSGDDRILKYLNGDYIISKYEKTR